MGLQRGDDMRRPFYIEVFQCVPGGDVWKWRCLECPEGSGIWYRHEERAKEMGAAHVHDLHGPRVIARTIPMLMDV